MAELKLIEAINEKEVEKVKYWLTSPKLNINYVDENGMSPLQHACFKGVSEIVDLLLKLGADVNANNHNMGYTALMFGALSGNEEVVYILLSKGAKTYHTNSVGRTASQMAAFVGNHKIATMINNYIDKDYISKFTIPSGVNQKIRLSPFIVDEVHNLANQMNFSPVKVCITLRNQDLLVYWKEIANVFDSLSRQNFDPHNTNEGLSIKFHLIAFGCSKAGAAYDSGDKDLKDFLKKLLTPGVLEKFLRQGLKEFIHLESQLYRIIISELCKVSPEKNHPSAIEILSNRINGQGFFRNNEDKLECSTCFTFSKNNKQCSNCSQDAYCNVECQKLHWFVHKKLCKQFKTFNSSGLETEGQGDCEIKCRNIPRDNDD